MAKAALLTLVTPLALLPATGLAAQPIAFFWAGHSQEPKLFSWAWINRSIFDHVQVSGQRDLAMHLTKTTGDAQAYGLTTYNGQGNRTFTDLGSMNVAGTKVLGVFNFDFQFADNSFQDPLASKLSLNYNRGGLRIDAGDIFAFLPTGNRFTSFSRQLYGLYGSYTKGRSTVALLQSKSKSTTQTVSFQGNNSAGPYFLQNSQILDDVQVQVDGKPYTLGVDFTLDQVVGSITFKDLVVAPTSTITVSYQSVGLNSGGGQIQGALYSYEMGRFGSISASVARQTDPLAGGLKNFTERFQGYNDASLPYQLQYAPASPAAAVVTLDGIPQIYNVDYYFSTANPTFLFFYRTIPTTSTITVSYNPLPTNNLHGDRTVSGLNYSLPLGKKGRDGSFSYSTALGQLSNSTTPSSGIAKGIDANYKFKTYKLTISADDIPTSFVGINATGFLRNEISDKITLENKVRKFGYGIQTSNSAIANSTTLGNGSISYVPSRSTTFGGFLTYGDAGSSNWRLDQNHLAGYDSTGVTRADQTSLTYSTVFGKFQPRLVLSRTEGLGSITSDTGSTSQGHVALNSIGLGTSYQPSKIWTFGTQTTFDDIKTANKTGHGEDIDLTALYTGLKKVTWSNQYTWSNSGSLASLGQFSNGTGDGYNGNGFSNGIGNGLSTNSFNTSASNIRRLSTNLQWAPNDRESFNLNVSGNGQTGDITSNSNTSVYQFVSSFRVSAQGDLSFVLSHNVTDFSNAAVSRALTNIYTIDWRDAPKGPWSYQLGLSTLSSSGSAQSQGSLSLTTQLAHKLHKNQTLAVEYVLGRVTNYLAQDQNTFRASYTYHWLRALDLIAAYNIRSVLNKDATVTSGAYTSRGLDLELRLNFGR